MGDMDALIVLKGVKKVYARGTESVTALEGVDLQIFPGCFIAIMGPSGCGKSTLLHLLGGLDRPTSGEIWLKGEAAHRFTPREWTARRRRQVAIIFQFFHLIDRLSAWENVAFPLRLRGERPDHAQSLADEALREVGLHGRKDHLPHTLSGGEAQRVAVARAWAIGPEILLADEPTGNLDSKNGEGIIDLLAEGVRRRGMTVVFVTHSPAVSRVADCLVHLHDGKIDDIHPRGKGVPPGPNRA